MELQKMPVASSDLDENRVVAHSHELTECYYDLDKLPFSLMVVCLSAVDFNKPWDGMVEITPCEFTKAVGGPANRAIPRLRSAVEKLANSHVVFPYITEDGSHHPTLRGRRYSWLEFDDMTIAESDSSVILKFSPALVPHLSRLGVAISEEGDKTLYTSMPRKMALTLSGSFSFHLYMLLNVEVNLNRKKVANGSNRLSIPVSVLANICGVSYSRWADFKRRHLDRAINEINSTTNIDVGYKTTKKGRMIVGLEFNYRRTDKDVLIDGEFSLRKRPVRPRLLTKPKLESKLQDWADKNLKILINHSLELRKFNPDAEIPIKLLRDIIKFKNIAMPGSDFLKEFEVDLNNREARLETRKQSKSNKIIHDFIASVERVCSVSITPADDTSIAGVDYVVFDFKLAIIIVRDSTTPTQMSEHFNTRNELGLAGWLVMDIVIDELSGIDSSFIDHIKKAIELRSA